MSTVYARPRSDQSRSSLWWLSVFLWSLVGLMLVLAFLRSRADLSAASGDSRTTAVGTESAAPVGAASTEVTSDTDAVGPLAPSRGRSAGNVSVFSDPSSGNSDEAERRASNGSPDWLEDGPVSDFVLPADGWGAYSATCPDASFLVYAARTEPRKYEYTICSRPDGSLTYHGIDVGSGAEIRLNACIASPGRYVAQASVDYRYEIVDARSGSGSESRITLYRSPTDIDWRYDVHSEWGMQNLPPEFVKC